MVFCRVARFRVVVEHLSGRSLSRSFPILNDVLFTNANPAATSQYILNVGSQQEFHKSSGIWLATAVGSTAAILAAGGCEYDVARSAISIRVRELYKAGGQMPSLIGGIFSLEQTSFMIENRCEHALLALDGQHGAVSLDYGDRVTVERAPDLQLAQTLRNIMCLSPADNRSTDHG